MRRTQPAGGNPFAWDESGNCRGESMLTVEGDVAVVFGTAELRFAAPGEEGSVQNPRYTSTYVKRQGPWRMLALQMQPRAPK